MPCFCLLQFKPVISCWSPGEEHPLLQKGDESLGMSKVCLIFLLSPSLAWVKSVFAIFWHRSWFLHCWRLLVFSSELFIFEPIIHQKWHPDQDTVFQLKFDQHCLWSEYFVLNPKVSKIFSLLSNWRQYISSFTGMSLPHQKTWPKHLCIKERMTLLPLLMGRKCHKNNRSCAISISSAAICELKDDDYPHGFVPRRTPTPWYSAEHSALKPPQSIRGKQPSLRHIPFLARMFGYEAS